MDSAMSIAASGMQAALMQLAASASNVANMQANGPLPATGPNQPVAQTQGSVYQPVTVSQTTAPGGGVQAGLSPSLPSYVLAYDPNAPFANLQGMVAAPNVNPAAEAVNQITASLAFKANLAAFKAAESNAKALVEAMA
jgi:flagellar basal-body rod protein FlgC